MIVREETTTGIRERAYDPGAIDGIPGTDADTFIARLAREESARNERLLAIWRATTGLHYTAGKSVGPKGKPIIDLVTGKTYPDARAFAASNGFVASIPSGVYGALAAQSSWRGTWPAYLEPRLQDKRRRKAELIRRRGL